MLFLIRKILRWSPEPQEAPQKPHVLALRANWRQQALYVTNMRTTKNAVGTNYTCHDYGKFLWEKSAVVLPQCFLVALHIKLAMGLNHVEYII